MVTECIYCNETRDVSVQISTVNEGCKYHGNQIGKVFSLAEIAPKGLCRTLFYYAYPASLATLYSGKPRKFWFRARGINTTVVKCPAPQGVKIRVRSKEILPRPIRLLKEFVEEMMKLLFRGFDAPFRKVEFEIIEAGSSCPKGYKLGEKFYFNINDSQELCPAAFSAIFPYVNYLSNMEQKDSRPNSMPVHCPDYVGVTFDVKVD